MSNYEIKDYTYEKAKLYGFIVRPSLKKNKKVDVYDKNNILLVSIGHSDYSDYPTYIKTHGKDYAENRRRLYRCRHKCDILVKYSAGWFAYNLLW